VGAFGPVFVRFVREENSGVNKQIQFASAMLALSLVLAIYGILVFANAEKERDLQALQIQMNLVADSRLEAIEHWLQGQYAVLERSARHPPLRKALEDMSQLGASPDETLRELLSMTVERMGFLSRQTTGYPSERLETGLEGGLALLDPQGRLLASTSGMPPIVGCAVGVS